MTAFDAFPTDTTETRRCPPSSSDDASGPINAQRLPVASATEERGGTVHPYVRNRLIVTPAPTSGGFRTTCSV
jgi:hypothetical protein